MQIVYSKTPDQQERGIISDLAFSCGILYETARLLYCRGLKDKKSILKFLSPSEKHFYNPFLLNGMQEAVLRIQKARDLGEKVVVFGDYDADGVCATKVLSSTLKEYGINTQNIIPERENGYGLNINLVLKEHEKGPIGLIITVDCGISDGEKIKELNLLGIDVIVTDHHEPPEILPECIKINPKIKGQEYPFNGLCGAGVAYKLSYALIGEKANKYLDFVALATVADSMDLIDENRDIVCVGLKIFNNNLKDCFKHLLPQGSKKITARDLGFTLAPKINAGGRMGDINSVLKLFFATDQSEIYDLSIKLTEYNVKRQTECAEIVAEAKSYILENKLYNDKVITVYGENWKTGLIAIVAAKLAEEFSRPTIVFGTSEGKLRGSARSVEGINIFDAINANKNLLIAFGGHSQAAGITLEKDNFNSFKKGVNSYVEENFSNFETEEIISAEWNIEGDFSYEFANEIELLEPFGPGFNRPQFTFSATSINAKPLKPNSPHLTFKELGLEMLYFYSEKEQEFLNIPNKKVVVFEPSISYFNNKQYVKGLVKKVVSTKEYGKEILPYILESQLKNCLKSSNYTPKFVSIDNVVNVSKKTVFAHFNGLFSDDNMLLNGLNTYLFAKSKVDSKNSAIISPIVFPDGVERVVYLERPLFVPETMAEVVVLKNGNSLLNYLSLDRDDFTWAYSKLMENKNKEFISSVELFAEEGLDRAMQGVFATEVFKELGFFKHENNKLISVYGVKAPLTESKIYNLISEVKSGL